METVDNCDHDDGNQGKLAFFTDDFVDEVSDVSGGRRKDQSSEEIEEDEQSHAEKTEAAHVFQTEKFDKIVNGGVDPSTSLREQHAPCIRCICQTSSI